MLDLKDKSYTPSEVAGILNCSVFTVHELLREGRLKGFKITSRWRVTKEELEKFIKANGEKE